MGNNNNNNPKINNYFHKHATQINLAISTDVRGAAISLAVGVPTILLPTHKQDEILGRDMGIPTVSIKDIYDMIRSNYSDLVSLMGAAVVDNGVDKMKPIKEKEENKEN